MNIQELSTVPRNELYEHFIKLLLEGNGPSDEETVFQGIRELESYLTKAILLQSISNGDVLINYDKNKKEFCFRVGSIH